MQETNKVAASWLLAEKLMRLFYGVFVSAAVARYLGPDDYGLLSLALGVIAVVNAASSMGAEHINVSELSRRNSNDSHAFLASALLVRLLWSFFCLGILLIFLSIQNAEIDQLMKILMISVPFGSFFMVGNKLQADGKFSNYAILAFSSILFSTLTRSIGIILHLPVEYFSAAFIADSIFYVLLLFISARKDNAFNWHLLKPNPDYAFDYFKMCLPTAISFALAVIYLKIELFVINDLLGKAATGLWAAMLMFITPWGMIASSIVPIANRHLAKAFTSDDRYEEQLAKLIRYMFLLSTIVVFINIIAVNIIVPLLMGEKYTKVTEIVWISSFAIIPLFAGTVQEIWIAHQRTTLVVLKKILIGLPVSILLLYTLIPSWGLQGAAFAMVCSNFLTQLLLNLLFDRNFLKLQLKALLYR